MLRHLPLMAIPLAVLNIIVLLGSATLQTPAFTTVLVSGAAWSLLVGDLVVLLAVILLYAELLKATRTGTASIVDHLLSLAVFVIFLLEFLLVPSMGTNTVFVVMAISLVDVISGFTVTIVAARRDVDFER